MKPAYPVIVLPNIGESAEGIPDLLTRFNLYGKYFAEVAQTGYPILVLAGGNFENIDNSFIQELHFIKLVKLTGPTNNPFYFAYKCARFLKSNSLNPSILIASNLYVGFVASYLISKLLRDSQRIQVSIHGSLRRFNDSIFRAWIRRKYIWWALAMSSSIRVVSADLLHEVSNSYGLPKTKFFVSPVPVNLRGLKEPKLDGKVLAFVGRMHPERGLDGWVQIVKSLSLVRQDFQLLLIGDGPLSHQFERDLRNELSSIQITAKGFLNRNELADQWKHIKVLLSTAPSEGYGLALREAIASQTYVCAKKSIGSEPLAEKWPTVVKTFSTEDDAVLILNYFLDQKFPANVSKDFTFSLTLENNLNLKNLANSWI
jgi:glycosyltransferase involved in cell wall biosynthesis